MDSNPNAKSTNLKEVLVSPAAAASIYGSGNPLAIPMAQTSGLVAALLWIEKLMNEIQEIYAEQNQLTAQTLMGTDGNGNIDLKNGIVSHFQDAAVHAGESQASAIESDMIGEAMQLSFSGASMLGMGASALSARSQTNALKPEMDNAELYEKALKGPKNNALIQRAAGSPVRQEVQDRMNDYEHGIGIDNFAGDEVKGGEVKSNPSQKALNKEAVEHLKANKEAYRRALKGATDQTKAVENKKSAIQANHDKNVQMLNIAGQGLNAAGTMTGNILKQKPTEEAAKQQAAADIVKTVQQKAAEMSSDFKQKADDAHRDANQWASAIAQTAQSQTKV
jgi:hypothetical protein